MNIRAKWVRWWQSRGLRGNPPLVVPGPPLTFNPLPGMVLIPNELQLIDLIAKHGMGSVWKARDMQKQQEVVVKFPMENNALGAAILAEEHKFLERLDHPNIVRVFGLKILSPKHLCIMEELLQGQDFEAWRRDQPQFCFPWCDIQEYAMQVVQALAYSHTQSVFHRDVKPQNIMRVDVPGQPSFAKIIDFGIASQQRLEGNLDPIMARAYTLDYVGPEQLGGRAPHPSDDVYSYCATLYHLLTGCTVFEGVPGRKEQAIRYANVINPNDRLKESQVGFRIPDNVVGALMRGLRKHTGGTDGRPQDINRIRRMLERTPNVTKLVVCGDRWDGGKPEKVRVAVSGLMVMECLRESLMLKEFFEGENLQLNPIPHKWDGSILAELNEGSLDCAVINRYCLEKFLQEYPEACLEVVCPCARSMGGQCFYLIGREQTFIHERRFQDLPELLAGNTIYVNDLVEHRDAVELFVSEVMPAGRRQEVNVTVVDAAIAFKIIEDHPQALVYCGQNFRQIARLRTEVTEVVKFTECPPGLQAKLERYTENCLVVNRSFGNFAGLAKLKAHGEAAQKQFMRKCQKPWERREIIRRLSSRIDDYDLEEREFEEAMEQILNQTFSAR